MRFVHDDPDFDGLLQIVADNRELDVALVEKDYWVTHTLWALQAQGFDVWFKGGTSLSKGFGLIERFSEDLDLKLEPGTVTTLRSVTNWKSEGKEGCRRAQGPLRSSGCDAPGAGREGDARQHRRHELSKREPAGRLPVQAPCSAPVGAPAVRASGGRQRPRDSFCGAT